MHFMDLWDMCVTVAQVMLIDCEVFMWRKCERNVGEFVFQVD